MYVWSPLPRSLSATFRDISHSKARVRLSAIPDLVRWAASEERDRCIAQLIATLGRDEDLEVRAAAALALADTGAPEALGALMDIARGGPPRLRQLALVAIGELAEPGDVEALVQVRAALASEAPALRFQALVAAGRLCSDAEVASHLTAALADEEARVRYVACRIIEERFLTPGREKAPPRVLLDGLSKLVSDAEPEVATVAAILLAPRGSQPARELLVSALNQRRRFSHPDDEQAAIELCVELHLDAARPGLAARAFGGVLGGASPLAFQARVALASLGDERARRHIVRGLSAWSRAARSEAVAAAGQARLQAARGRLLEMRGDERQADASCVAEALSALDH
jgi:HEAT repeat protein